jgi:RsiW-degrading membrane proteinase PrsW (M82 family)
VTLLPVWSIYLLTLAPFLACLLLYGLRSPWHRSAVGRSMITLYATIVTVLAWVAFASAAEVPEELRMLIRVPLLGAVSAAGWVQLVMIVRLQRRRRADRKE